MNLLSLHSVFVLILFSSISFGQEPFFREYKLPDPYREWELNIIYQDRGHMVWFGGTGGLIQFNGVKYSNVEFADSLNNREVTALYEDLSGNMWMGFESGDIAHLKGNKVVAWDPEEGTPVHRITGFIEDKKGRIWIATYGEGVYCWNGKRLYNFDLEDGLLGEDIYDMVICNGGLVWIGTDRGLNSLTMEGEKKKVERFTKEDGLPDEIIKSLDVDKNGHLWLGMHDMGIARFIPEEKKVVEQINIPELRTINCLELTSHHEVWMGTEDHGLWRYNLAENRYQHITQGGDLMAVKIFDLTEDLEGNMWIGADQQRILSGNMQFETLDLDIHSIQAVLHDSQDRLWVGNPSTLKLYHWKEGSYRSTGVDLPQKELNVLSLFEDGQGNIWVGTFGQGLFVWSKEGKYLNNYQTSDGLVNGSILSIAGNDNQIWLATLGGISEFSIPNDLQTSSKLAFNNYDQTSGLGSNYIYKVIVDREGKPWFATDGFGVAVKKGEQIIMIDSLSGNPLNVVYSITQCANGDVWCSTAQNGLFRVTGPEAVHIDVGDGLRMKDVRSIISDQKGNILILNPQGIDLFQPSRKHFIYYDEEIGLEKIDPNLNAVHEDHLGNIWMGTQDGIIKYNLFHDSLIIHPETHITQINVFQQPVDYEDGVELSYNENYISFDYVGLWYTAPERVKYQYILEGYDLEWNASKGRRASYSNLSPGEYAFKVKASENKSFTDEPTASFSFEILKPFWLRWWFLSLMSIVTLGGAYYIVKQREFRSQRQALIKKERVESQLQALKAQINPHFLFNSFNALINMIEDDPDRAVEYVEKLSDFYRNILQYREKELISLEEEMELVSNYYYLLKKRFGDNLSIHFPQAKNNAFIPPLTVQMLVENAVKHNVISKSKPLKIQISCTEENYLEVSNNLQRKRGTVPSTNFGLNSLVNRYQLLSDKKVEVIERDDQFIVRIPLLDKEVL